MQITPNGQTLGATVTGIDLARPLDAVEIDQLTQHTQSGVLRDLPARCAGVS